MISTSQGRHEQKNKAIGFLALLTSKDYVNYMHFLWDVTEVLARLSKTLQRKTNCVSDTFVELKLARSGLESLLER